MTTEQKAALFEKIRECCGYVENGTSTVVRVFQDDATREWVIRVGKGGFYFGNSLAEAVEEAYKVEKQF